MLLIDGYNLLHATDLFGGGAEASALEGSRTALLEFLADRLSEREQQDTRIVFDAAGAPAGLPKAWRHAEISVLFARDYPDADAMLEHLIEQEPAPKQLLVVSSDHRVQRAARRAGAGWIDSSTWYVELRRRSAPADLPDAKQISPRDVGDTAYWVARFSEPPGEVPPADPTPASESRAPGQTENTDPPLPSPFPPGYAEDLARELEESDHPELGEGGDQPRGRR